MESGSNLTAATFASSSNLLAKAVKTGTFGTCTWEIGSDGVLALSPSDSGSGTLGVVASPGSAPWYAYRELVTSARIDQGVKAGESTAYLFEGLESMESVDLSKLDTTQTTNMNGMFKGCGNLKAVDLSGLNLTKVTHFSEMFADCASLAIIGLSGVNTADAVDMSGMFRGCSKLATLDATRLTTGKVTDFSRMFEGCAALSTIDLSGFSTANATNMYGMFLNCSGLTSLDLSKFDTSKVDDMMFMFAGCSSLKSLDLSKFNTSCVTDMSSMFSGCSTLGSVNVSGFDTSKVVHMDGMFASCSALESLDLSSFETGNVEGMSSLFENCAKLKALDLPTGFSTSKVKTMNGMFAFCASLPSLNLSQFSTGSVEDMALMFAGCSELSSIDLSGFDTKSVSTMDSMFWACDSLVQLDLSHLDFSSLTVARSMFFCCGSLERIHLPASWSAHSLDMAWMFYGCSMLKTISVPSVVDLRMVGQGESVFTGCLLLKGGEGTEYSAAYTGPSYAHSDGLSSDGSSLPGYFSIIPAHEHVAGASAKENVVAATCIQEGSYELVARCTVCGDILLSEHVILPALGHDWDEGAVTAQPTCTKPGVRTFTCKNDANHTRTEAIDATGHKALDPVRENKVAATCTAKGSYDLVTRCETCGTVISSKHVTTAALGHSWSKWTTVKAATYSAAGKQQRTCSRCGKIESKTIAKLLRPVSTTTVKVTSPTYKGKAVAPTVTVTLSGKKLKAGTDYTLKYLNAKGNAIAASKVAAVGSYYVTVTGKGSYTGSVKKAFKVNKASITSATFAKIANQKLKKQGTAVTPKPTVKFAGKKLKLGTDYTLTYKNNKKTGTASVVVAGKGSFTGSKAIKFKIVK